MKHLTPLNRKARAWERRTEHDVSAHACSVCCAAFAPGWEVGRSGNVDPCPWENDLAACYYSCYWSGQVPDPGNYPNWLDACSVIVRDWGSLCVVPDI